MRPAKTTRRSPWRSRERDVAPTLSNIGNKMSADWLTYWIEDPTRYWHDTRMPKLRLSRVEAASIAQYLLTLKDEPKDAAKVTAEEINLLSQRGQAKREDPVLRGRTRRPSSSATSAGRSSSRITAASAATTSPGSRTTPPSRPSSPVGPKRTSPSSTTATRSTTTTCRRTRRSSRGSSIRRASIAAIASSFAWRTSTCRRARCGRSPCS